MQPRIVFISGIGADRRAFSRLKFPEKFKSVYADWIPLTQKQESFLSYCERIIETYNITPKDILIGLSFGGLISQQIAYTNGNKKVILINSFRSKKDLKPLMYFGLKSKLYKILPPFRIPIISDFTAFFLNSWNNESRILIKQMLKDANFKFIGWCIKQIDQVDLTESFSSKFLCFTGKDDKLVSDWESPNHISIQGGSHFMVYDRAEDINPGIISYLD